MRARPLPPIPESWFAVDRYVVENRGYGTSCWVWKFSVDESGYGQTVIRVADGRRRNVRPHRVYFERVHGPVTDPELQLHHLCGIKRCVNPAHLEPVTPQQHADVTPRKRRLSDEAVAHIRRREMTKRRYAALYGVSHAVISAIWAGRIYKNAAVADATATAA